jgi:hypothetical protein
MNAFQALNDVNQDLAHSFSGLPTGCQQSTIWIAHTEETPIAAIKSQKKDMILILKVYISDIHLVKLNLQITPETVLIQGQPTEAAGVEGYFLYLAQFSISLLGTGKMPVPQENLLFVERAEEPVLENGARCELFPS